MTHHLKSSHDVNFWYSLYGIGGTYYRPLSELWFPSSNVIEIGNLKIGPYLDGQRQSEFTDKSSKPVKVLT